MRIFLVFKVTFLSLGLSALSCAQQPKEQKQLKRDQSSKEIIVGANRTTQYMPLLQNKKVGVVANQTSVIFKPSKALEEDAVFTHLVDSLLTTGIQITKVFSPEHGFRGQADAGEEVSDGLVWVDFLAQELELDLIPSTELTPTQTKPSAKRP